MIIGIESSCDESAVALFAPQRGVVGEWVHSQVARHQPFGGIVPDIASREHLDQFPRLSRLAFTDYQPAPGDWIAVTAGPGLAGSLALGLAYAHSLAIAWGLPIAGVHHLRGHAYSPFISLHAEDPGSFSARLAEHLPHLGLIASGGNSILFALDTNLRLSVLAGTVDDAAGEALDKGAKLLGLPYPGGPLIEQAAAQGNPAAYDFPRPFARSAEPSFSFSGLKTSLRYLLDKLPAAALQDHLPDICASYQAAVVDSLTIKTRQFLRRQPWRSLGLSGGVANNRALRDSFAQLARHARIPLLLAQPRHCGDNATMIAFAAFVDASSTLPCPTTFLPAWGLDSIRH